MPRQKSFNKLPRPFAEFLLYATIFEAFAYFATRLLYPSLAGDVLSPTIAQLLKTFTHAAGQKAELPDEASVLAVATVVAVTAAVALAAHSYRAFHSGAWLGEKPSPNRSYGSSAWSRAPSP